MSQPAPLTDEQLNDIDARVTAATQGPWGAYTFGGDTLIEIAADLEDTGTGYSARRGICRLEDEPLDNDPTHQEWTAEEDWAQVQADAEFIAHAPADVAVLLAEVRRLQALRRYLVGQLAKKDAASGAGDRALREFLAAPEAADASVRPVPAPEAPAPQTAAVAAADGRTEGAAGVPTAERFTPTAADFDHNLHGVPVAYFASGDLIAYTTDRPQAIAALNEYLRADEGEVDERLLELRWVCFERQPTGAEHSWIAGLATEADDGAVQAHWLFAHA